MLMEVPELKRCCFCWPLRRGILVFGYLSLLVTCLFGIQQVLLWLFFRDIESGFSTTDALYRGVIMEAQLCVIFILYALDILFHIVLVVGAHLKRRRLLRVFYYYELMTMVASFIVVVITYVDLDRVPWWHFVITKFTLAFIGFVLQIYLLLLVRSELRKDRYHEGRSSYTNHIAEVFVEPPLRRQWTT